MLYDKSELVLTFMILSFFAIMAGVGSYFTVEEKRIETSKPCKCAEEKK